MRRIEGAISVVFDQRNGARRRIAAMSLRRRAPIVAVVGLWMVGVR